MQAFSSPELTYNPFGDHQALKQAEHHSDEFMSLEISSDGNDTAYNSKIGTKMSLEERLRDVERREKDLAAREKIIGVKITDDKTPDAEEKVANWPHEKLPLVYHDIEKEVPENMQFLVNMGYLCWKITCAALFTNTLAVLHAGWTDAYYGEGREAHTVKFYAILYALAGVPISFCLWYFNLYRVTIKAKTSHWMIFMVSFCLHLLFCAVILSGIPTQPCAGLYFTIELFMTSKYLSASLGLVNSLLWVIVAIYSAAIFTTAKRFYMTKGGKEQTEEDLKSGVKGVTALAYKMHPITGAVANMKLPQ